MTDTIGVEFAPQDAAFIASTKSAAAQMAKLAAQEERLGAAAKEMGLNGRKFAQAFAKQAAEESRAKATAAKTADKALKDEAKQRSAADKVAKSEQERIKKSALAARAAEDKAAEKAAKRKEADAKRDAATAKRTQDKNAAAAKQAAKVNADFTKKRSEAAAVQLREATALASATLGIAAAVGAAVVGYVALTVAIGKSALEARQLRNNAVGFFNVLTRGRGDKTLEYVDKLASRVGVSFDTARQQMIEFRQAGLGNKQSAQLIKLAADLNTVDRSGELAKQAIARVLTYTANGTQTKDQANASARAMALLAKQAGVAGDGTKAAAAAMSTLAGATTRIDNAKTKALERIGDKVAPAVDRAATAVANLVERFADSARGKQAIDLVSDSVIGLANAVTYTANKADAAGKMLDRALANPAVKLALDGIKIAAYVAGAALAVAAAGAALLLAPLVALTAAAVLALGALGRLVKGAINLGPQMWGAGKDIISGLVKGISDGAGDAAAAVANVASKMKASFKRALGINSPSKVFKGYGVNIGEGTQQGIAASMPTGSDIASMVAPENKATLVRPGSGAGSAAGGSTVAGGVSDRSISVVIENITVPTGEDPDRWSAALTRQLGSGLQAILLSQGAPT